MTPKLIRLTQDQIHDHVFCQACEARLNTGGEHYLMSLVADGKKFRLRDMLRVCKPIPSGPYLRFSGRQAGVDTAKLAYFAISLLWRGAVHPWHTLEDQTTQVKVGSRLEEMRRYLLSETPLPPDIVVFTLVCLDSLSQMNNTAPYLVGGYEHENRFEMLLSGIVFHVAIGRPQMKSIIIAVFIPVTGQYSLVTIRRHRWTQRGSSRAAKLGKGVNRLPG